MPVTVSKVQPVESFKFGPAMLDLDRDSSENEIDKQAVRSIQQLTSNEKRFKAKCKTSVDLEEYNDLIESSKKKLIELETCLNLFSAKKEERDKIEEKNYNS